MFTVIPLMTSRILSTLDNIFSFFFQIITASMILADYTDLSSWTRHLNHQKYIDFCFNKLSQIRTIPKIIGFTFILFLVCFASLSTRAMQAKPKVEFKLKDLKIIQMGPYPGVLVYFQVSDKIIIKVIDPDGIKTDERSIGPDEVAVKLRIAEMLEIPSTGDYTLIVRDTKDNVIFKDTFSVEKPLEYIKANLKI
jgi:hypothetical protein